MLSLLLAATSCRTTERGDTPERVLFVGNSLTYYGNLPAVYSALNTANGRPTTSDMIVEAGATLDQRLADGSVVRALEARRYSALVLQERGGDLIGAFGPQSVIASRKAIKDLAVLAQGHDVEVVLLGSYQGNPEASRRLVDGESAAAKASEVRYIEVSERLRQFGSSHSELTWFAEDGMHPGKHLALLNAVLIYQVLHGALPEAIPLQLTAPIYGEKSGLVAELRQADTSAPHDATPTGTDYPASTLALILEALNTEDGG